QLLIERQRREAATREKQLALANANIVDQQLQLEESKRQNLIGFVVAMGIILLVALISLVYIRRSRQLLAVAKSQSDDLLLNILPVAVADELKSQGAAAPKQYEQVSVLFVDITGFTRIAEKLSPAELVAELDGYFREFDAITEQHNLEKIKTIGDAYMCAGGIPEPNTTNAVDAVQAAMGILACVQRLNGERAAGGQDQWNVRIGIHTGRVVAGVVGAKKFAYDIWGDAVNTAARLESTSEPGRLNISKATHELVKNRFACTYRGQIAAKNKGLIDMYFVDGPLA
ncbi:MAG: adenylate/guanylate cyclase domain-containing protein, partial [Bacteroidota bacterium]